MTADARWRVDQHPDDPHFYRIIDRTGKCLGLATSHKTAMNTAEFLARHTARNEATT